MGHTDLAMAPVRTVIHPNINWAFACLTSVINHECSHLATETLASQKPHSSYSLLYTNKYETHSKYEFRIDYVYWHCKLDFINVS